MEEMSVFGMRLIALWDLECKFSILENENLSD